MSSSQPDESPRSTTKTAQDLIYVGLNSRIIALDRTTGEIVWKWKSPRGRGFVSVLLDGDQLVAAVSGYVSGVDPLTGSTLWHNPLKGLGAGFTSLASMRGTALPLAVAALSAQQAAAAAGAASHQT